MTKDEALDLALEALEKISRTQYHIETPPVESLEEQMRRIADKAITAIKQARALDKKAENARELGLDYEPSAKVHDFWDGYVPEPVKAAPVQEPVAWMEMVVANLVREGVNKHKARELAEHFYWFAQRPFVGLTDEERDHIWHVIGNSDAHGDVDGLSGRDVMAAIEAKLRSKNNENTD